MELLQQCSHFSNDERPSFMATLAINGNGNHGNSTINHQGISISSSSPKDDNYSSPLSPSSLSSMATFIISEYTSFKQINHICLKLSTLNEISLKRYLADLIRRYREEAENLKIQLGYHIGSGGASASASANANTTSNLGMGGVSRPSVNMMDPINYAYNPGRDQIYEDSSRVKALQDRCSNLEATNKYLSELRYSLEGELSKLKGTSSAVQITANEIILREKQNEITKLNEIINSQKESKKHIEEGFHQQKTQITSLETNTRQLMNDINKANEIIRKLQEEIRSNKGKLKNTEGGFRQQEKIVKTLEQTQENLKKDLSSLQQELEESRKQQTICSIDKQSLQRELEESKQRIENDQNGIDKLIDNLFSLFFLLFIFSHCLFV